jgi:PAS domain-containing protein
VIAEMVNISDEMAAHEVVRAREQLLDRLAEALPVGVIQVDTDGSVACTNSQYRSGVGGRSRPRSRRPGSDGRRGHVRGQAQRRRGPSPPPYGGLSPDGW